MWIDLILIHLNSHMKIKTNLRISQTKYIFNVIKVSFVLIIKKNHLYGLYNIMTCAIVLDRRKENDMWLFTWTILKCMYKR